MSATQKLTHEMTILGCLISYGAAAYSECVDAGLCDADFTIDRHKRLWSLLSRHAEAGEPLDLVRTIEAIIEADEQEAFGGLAYVAALPDSVPLLQLLPSYLREVRHGSQRRGLLHLGWWLCEQAAGVDLSVDELVAGVHERADAAASATARATPRGSRASSPSASSYARSTASCFSRNTRALSR